MPTQRDGSRTNGSGRFYPKTDMSYWLERIKQEDIEKLWKRLRDSARDAKHHITLERWVNGIISRGERAVNVIAYTTEDGFVLRFTAVDTSTLNGARNEQNQSGR